MSQPSPALSATCTVTTKMAKAIDRWHCASCRNAWRVPAAAAPDVTQLSRKLMVQRRIQHRARHRDAGNLPSTARRRQMADVPLSDLSARRNLATAVTIRSSYRDRPART